MKPFHITGAVLHLSGHVPVRNGVPLHPGRLGETVSIEQGIEAAQWTAMNALACMNVKRRRILAAQWTAMNALACMMCSENVVLLSLHGFITALQHRENTDVMTCLS